MIQMWVAVLGVLLAACFDWKIKKIPNALTFSMMISGLILNFWSQGLSGLGYSLLGLVCGVLFLYFPFVWGGVGGGDVKLVGAIGSLLGPYLVFTIFLASAVFGGILSLAVMIRKRAVRRAFQGVKNRIFYFLLTQTVLPEREEGTEQHLRIPYACAISCGMLFVLFVLKGG